MAVNAWAVTSTITYRSNGLEVLQRLTRATIASSEALERLIGLTQTLAEQNGGLSRTVSASASAVRRQAVAFDSGAAAADRYAAAVDRANMAARFRGSAGAPGGGGGSGSGGGEGWSIAGLLAGAAAFIGLRGAGDLEQSLNAINIAGVSKQQLPQIHKLALNMSKFTAQTEAQSTALLAVMAQSGLNSIPGMSTLDALTKLSTPIAQFADVNYLATGKKHLDFDDSAVLASGLAHDLKIYDTTGMKNFLDTFSKLGNMTGDGPKVIGTMMRAFAPAATRYGMSPDDIANFAALADRAGQSTRGGTGLNQLLQNLIAPRGSAKMGALVRMGVYNADGTSRFIDPKTGDVAFEHFVRFIADYEARMKAAGRGAEANRNLAQGFDVNANRVLGAIATKPMMDMLDKMRATEKTMPDLSKQQAILMQGFNSQVKLATSNFSTLTTETMYGLLPAFTNMASALANMFGGGASFLGDHPIAANAVGESLVAGGIYGVIKMLQSGKGIVGFTKHIGSEAVSLFLRLGKEFGTGFGGLTKSASKNFTSPILKIAEKLGPIGTRLTTFATGIGTNATAIELASTRFLSALAKIVPGLDIAALVLTPTQGGSMEDDPRTRAAIARDQADYRRRHGLFPGGGTMTVHNHVVVNANGANAEEVAKKVADRLHASIRNPTAIEARARNSTRIPAPVVGLAVLGVTP